MLSIAGKLCTQFEEPGLARQIYAEAVDGCHHLGPRRPGSGQRQGARPRAAQLMPTKKFPLRARWPNFLIRTQTVYRVAAPTAALALACFAANADIEFGVEVLDFGEVAVIDEVGA